LHPFHSDAIPTPTERVMELIMFHFRLYRHTATAIEKGVAAALLTDVKAGAAIMKAEGVPIEVALRVLLHPHERRGGTWQHV